MFGPRRPITWGPSNGDLHEHLVHQRIHQVSLESKNPELDVSEESEIRLHGPAYRDL